jgi:hypothetical protein
MKRHLIILIPVFDDWAALQALLREVDAQLACADRTVSALVVDDASTTPPPRALFGPYVHLARLRLLRLKTNLGHQRAIAIGLAYLHAHLPCDQIIVMDGDGEDRPQDVLTLLRQADQEAQEQIILAERAHRRESWVFRAAYAVYRLLFRLAAGQRIRFGNFSLLPFSLLERIVAMPDLWNNYAAALVKARLPMRTVACDRGARLEGKSKMNLVGLVVHGLSAISVYNETFGVRALLASVLVMLVTVSLGVGAAIIRLATGLAIPGWATYAVGLSIVGLLQAITLAVFFVFLILHNRNSLLFVPGRDYAYFVGQVMDQAASG